MKFIFFVFLSIFFYPIFPTYSQSQQISLEGKIQNIKNEKIEYAAVNLIDSKTNNLIKAELTNEEGFFKFISLPVGSYKLIIEHPEFEVFYGEEIELTENKILNPIVLNQREEILNEIAITVKKPFIEQHLDKTVININQSITSAGNTALEVLGKSPGVLIDGNDNISLRGRQGVMVMVNGKQTYLSSQELANYLKSISAENINTIEIITNPSAKYDAEGTAGIININLKKNENYGLNGSVSAGLGYGKWEKANAGLNLNFRNRGINLFGNFSNRYTRGFGRTRTIDRFSVRDNDTTIFNVDNYRPYRLYIPTFRTGIDWFINEKTTIGALVTGNFYILYRDMTSKTIAENPQSETLFFLDSYNNALFRNDNLTYNLNFKRLFAMEGQELSIDLDYSKFNGSNSDELENQFFSRSRNDEPDEIIYINSEFETDIEIKVGKLDYTHPLPGKIGTLEAGAKLSLVNTESEVFFETEDNEQWIPDDGRSDHFLYKENINALYLSYKTNYRKFGFQFGLRGEQTMYEGNSKSLGETFSNDYIELFPSIFLTRNFGENHTSGVSYSKRISRPSYQDLNPFVVYRDIYNYSVGNPLLEPQITQEYEFKYTYKGKYSASLGYSLTRGVITYVPEEDPATLASIGTFRNLEKSENYNFTLNFPLKLTQWWDMQNNIIAFYNDLEGEFNGQKVENSEFSVSANSTNKFKINSSMSGEISTQYNSPFTSGLVRFDPVFYMNAALQKNFWDSKATLRISMNDVLGSLRYVQRYKFNNVQFINEQTWESQQALLTFTYRFGKKSVKSERNRKTGSEEERNRIGS